MHTYEVNNFSICSPINCLFTIAVNPKYVRVLSAEILFRESPTDATLTTLVRTRHQDIEESAAFCRPLDAEDHPRSSVNPPSEFAYLQALRTTGRSGDRSDHAQNVH